MRIQFGSGFLFCLPVGVSGGGVFTGSPIQAATLQDIDVTIDATIKELRGNLQFPDDTAISDKKITFKIGEGRFDIDAWNQVYFADPITTGSGGANPGGGVPVVNEPTTLNSTSYTVAHTPMTQDMGVQYAATGQRLLSVASGPTKGQYSVNPGTGVYTFSASDNNTAILVSYRYSIVTGRLLKVQSHVQGYGPTFEMLCAEPYQELTANVPNYLDLYACKASKLTMPLKRVEYLISDIEGQAFSNAAGFVGEVYES